MALSFLYISRSTRFITSRSRRRPPTTVRPSADHEDERAWDRQHAWLGEAGGKLLQASTSEIYGNPSLYPQPESFWGQRQPDRTARLLRRGQALRRNLVLRLPSTAQGPDQNGPDLQHLWAADASEGRARRVELHRAGAARSRHHGYGDGTQTRSFCYVDDLVDQLIRLMDSRDDVTGPINFGNPWSARCSNSRTRSLR
jgi:nucleoside-diphosphate-sugar epimerase